MSSSESESPARDCLPNAPVRDCCTASSLSSSVGSALGSSRGSGLGGWNRMLDLRFSARRGSRFRRHRLRRWSWVARAAALAQFPPRLPRFSPEIQPGADRADDGHGNPEHRAVQQRDVFRGSGDALESAGRNVGCRGLLAQARLAGLWNAMAVRLEVEISVPPPRLPSRLQLPTAALAHSAARSVAAYRRRLLCDWPGTSRRLRHLAPSLASAGRGGGLGRGQGPRMLPPPIPTFPRKRGKEQILPRMLNCYCHPGRAGGSPHGY